MTGWIAIAIALLTAFLGIVDRLQARKTASKDREVDETVSRWLRMFAMLPEGVAGSVAERSRPMAEFLREMRRSGVSQGTLDGEALRMVDEMIRRLDPPEGAGQIT